MIIICPFVLRLGPIIIKKPNLLATTFTVSLSHFLKIEASENNAQIWWSALTNQITLCKPSGDLKMAENFRLSTGELFNQVFFFAWGVFFFSHAIRKPLFWDSNLIGHNCCGQLDEVRRWNARVRTLLNDLIDDSYISHSKLRMYYVCRYLETQPIASREKENVKGKRVGVSFDLCWKENIWFLFLN